MNKSFTLIEILVVIVVIGILSAFVLVGINSITNNANIAKSKAFSESLRNSLLTSLVSEWKLDGNANDSWGVSNGTWSGPTGANTTVNYRPSSECISGQCLDFDGTDDVVNFGNNASLSMGNNDHTVSIWIKFDNALAPQTETLFACGAGCGALPNCGGYWIRRLSGQNRLYAGFTDSQASQSEGYLSGIGTLINDIWYNIVVRFDRDGLVQSYINGQLQTGYSFNISSRQLFVSNFKSLTIGAWSASDSRLDGKIDEPKLYHSIVSSQLINQEYYSGINKLLVNSEINNDGFKQRLTELKSNLAIHE